MKITVPSEILGRRRSKRASDADVAWPVTAVGRVAMVFDRMVRVDARRVDGTTGAAIPPAFAIVDKVFGVA